MPATRHPYVITFRGGLLDGSKRRLEDWDPTYESLSMDKEGDIWREIYSCKLARRNKIEAAFVSKKRWRRQ